HNNHHAHGTSAKFSAKWYEIDLGWGYIQVLKFFGLAKVRKVAPKLKLETDAKAIDLRTLQGVITHRYEVMARYGEVIKTTMREELNKIKPAQGPSASHLQRVRRWLHRNEEVLHPEQRAEVDQAIAHHKSLSTLVQMRRELGRLWESSS